MFPAMEQKLTHFRELEEQLADPAIAADHSRFTTIAKEHGALNKFIKPYLEYLDVSRAIADAEAIAASNDPEMKALGEEELAQLRPRRDELHAKVEDLLLVDPEDDFDRLIVEIRGGEGGDEACLFAGDLHEMYTR